MEKKTNLTVTITGTHVDDDGELHVVDAKYDGVDAVFMNAYKYLSGLEVQHDTVIVGNFERTMVVKTIANIIEEVCEDETGLMQLLAESLKAFMSK